MAAEEDRADQEAGMKNSIVASVRSAKKAALPRKMTVVAPERILGQTPKKKKGKKKGGFEKELGMAGRAERENGGAGPDDPRRKSKQAGSNAGRRPIVGFGKGNKRMLKAGKRL
jgi:ATP-dependent RNA helicase DDX27